MRDFSRYDLELFEDLFKRYYSLLTAKSYQICNNWQMAEDAVQEFFADVWTKKSWNTITTQFAPYAVKAVQYKTIDILRKSIRQHPLNETGEHLQVADERLEAEQEDDRLQRELKLAEALNALPAQRKEAFLLAHYHNKSYSQISEQMGVSVNTVKTHLRLAMSQLREILLLIFLLFIFL